MLTNYPAKRPPSPESYSEIEDHNTGVSLLRSLHAYLRRRSPASRRFFSNLMRDQRVIDLLDESAAAVARHYERQQDTVAAHEAFVRMQQMHSPAFAQSEARKLRDLATPNGLATAPNSTGRSAYKSPKNH